MQHQVRKRFGQNFLEDASVISQIVEYIAPERRPHLLEIGPGRGALTHPLRGRSRDLSVIEIDRDLVAALRPHENASFHVLEGDVLERDLSQFQSPLTVVGNLPYNISTPLIFHLFQYYNQIDEMIFMLQKEVVERMAAAPASKEYGRLSVMTQYFCEVEALFLVPPEAFSPIPKVDSMVVSLRPWKTSPYPALSPEAFARFSEIVRLAFNQRRKTLKNALSSLHLSVPAPFAHQRAEELSVADFIELTLFLRHFPQRASVKGESAYSSAAAAGKR